MFSIIIATVAVHQDLWASCYLYTYGVFLVRFSFNVVDTIDNIYYNIDWEGF